MAMMIDGDCTGCKYEQQSRLLCPCDTCLRNENNYDEYEPIEKEGE